MTESTKKHFKKESDSLQILIKKRKFETLKTIKISYDNFEFKDIVS